MARTINAVDRNQRAVLVTGVTTAPQRTIYLDATLKALRDFEPIVFTGDGCFANWKRSLEYLSESDADLIALFQDDISICRNVKPLLETMDWPLKCGCVSLYTSAKDKHGRGFGRVKSTAIIGALAYVFPITVARRTLDDLKDWQSNRGIDILVPRLIAKLGLHFYTFSPSLVQHVGEVSTSKTGNAAVGRLQAADFVGTEFDALDYFGDYNLSA